MREILDILQLMALGIGYLVIYFAEREEKILRLAGYFIGVVIVSFTTFYIVFDLLVQSRAFEPRIQRYPGTMMQHRMMPPSMMPQK